MCPVQVKGICLGPFDSDDRDNLGLVLLNEVFNEVGINGRADGFISLEGEKAQIEKINDTVIGEGLALMLQETVCLDIPKKILWS